MMQPDPTKCSQPGCDGHIIVHHSRMTLKYRVQYLRCNKCGAKHGTRRTDDEVLARLTLVEARLKNLEESLSQRDTIGKVE